MASDHARIEERSIALHREIAGRIQSNPGLIHAARENLVRWIKQNGEIPVWKEWMKILDKPCAEILELLVSDHEEARRLRQSSPFCGILNPRERWTIYESFTARTYYQSRGKHSG